jgi:large subunit ribosomal protein L35
MPKVKTHRGAAKRVKRTASGQFKRAKAGKSHILTKKASKRKRHLRRSALISEQETRVCRRLVPYA